MTSNPTSRVASCLLFAVLCVAVSIPEWAEAAPEADLWERWSKRSPRALGSIDHGEWDRLVETYVFESPDGVNRVDYAGVTAADRRALTDYIAKLKAIAISEYNRREQFAFWVNLYNALTLDVVLDHLPVDSIADIDISPGLFTDGPWDKPLIEVEGVAISLNDIEHRILRPIWRDPRIHYAVNCASIGCPDLQPDAFTSANADKLMDTAARAYVNHPRGSQVVDEELVVSSIYVWYEEDFGGSDGGVIRHLRRYARPKLSADLARIDEIADDHYNWTLNDAHR